MQNSDLMYQKWLEDREAEYRAPYMDSILKERAKVKAKDHPAYQYHLTNAYKLTRQAEQMKKFHDSKKGK